MKTNLPRTFAIAASLSIALAGCSRDEPVSPQGGHAQAEEPPPTNRIDIPPTVQRNLGLTFAPVERRQIESTIRVPGAFETDPLARQEYRLTLDGQVAFEVEQYEPVEEGQVLFRFRSPQWPELQHEIIEAEQEIDSSRALIGVARAELAEATQRLALLRDRLAALEGAQIRRADLESQAAEFEARFPTLESQLALARTSLANAERTHEHALHRASAASGIDESVLASMSTHEGVSTPTYRTIDWIEVRALDAGVVETLAMTDGGFGEATSLVLSVVDPRRVRFRAMGLQSDLPRLTAAQGARITPPLSTGLGAGGSVAARMQLGLEAEPTQRTIAILATPTEERPWIRPGVSAFLEMVLDGSAQPVLAIPQSSVVRDGLVHVFFRRDPKDPGKAIRVEADLGHSDGRWVEVKSGLALSDQVVLDGAYELKLASQQSGTVQKGGHFHADGTFHEDDH